MTSPEARVRGSELSRKRPRHAQCAPSGPPFAPYEGQRASQSGRSRNEGIPEDTDPFDGVAAAASIFEFCGFDFGRRGFLAYDPANPKLKSSYTLAVRKNNRLRPRGRPPRFDASRERLGARRAARRRGAESAACSRPLPREGLSREARR